MPLIDVINRLNQLGESKNCGFHVTSAEDGESIVRDGFLAGWGDLGYGVYFWGSLASAAAYARRGGWTGSLEDPVVLKVCDPAIRRVHETELHPSWDPSDYEDMMWVELDEDEYPEDEDGVFWVPNQVSQVMIESFVPLPWAPQPINEGRYAELAAEQTAFHAKVRALIQQAGEEALRRGGNPGAVENAVEDAGSWESIYYAFRNEDGEDSDLIRKYVERFWLNLFDGYEDTETRLTVPNEILATFPDWARRKYAQIHGSNVGESFVKTQQPHWRERWVSAPTEMEGEVRRRLESLGSIYEVKREGGKVIFSVGTRWFPEQLRQYLPAGSDAG